MVRFGVVGGLGVGVNLLVFRTALWAGLNAYPSLANAIAVEMSIIFNYLLNARFTFRRPFGWAPGLQYNVVSLAGAAIQVGVFTVLIAHGVERTWADLLAIPFGTGITFVFSNVWVFRSRKAVGIYVQTASDLDASDDAQPRPTGSHR